MKRINIESIVEHVRESLTEAIVTGELAPNQALSERDLSIDLGVSRTPVREALYALEGAGFVTRRTRVGWRVAIPEQRSVEELFELRGLLEGAGIDRVVTWMTDRIRSLVTIFDGFDLDPGTDEVERYLEHDNRFHTALIDATENTRIVEIYQHVALHVDWFRHIVSYQAHERIRQSMEEHRKICAALVDRDAGAAHIALAEHLAHVQKEFLRLMALVESST